MIRSTRYISALSTFLGGGTGALIGGTKGAPPDIDLTAATLDSRVKYTGPAHYYRNSSGVLVKSAANVWPLEYKLDGTVAGRHEPEKFSANLVTSIQAEFGTTADSEGFSLFTENGGTNQYHRYRVNLADTGTLKFQMFYAPSARTFLAYRAAISGVNVNAAIQNFTKGYANASFQRFEVSQFCKSSTGRTMGILRAQFDFPTSGVNGLMSAESAVTDDSVPRTATNEASAFFAGLPQYEKGDVFTSPIDIGTSRAASSVVIDTGNSGALTLHFSNGDKVDVQSPGAQYTIPISQKDWGLRYLTKITFS